MFKSKRKLQFSILAVLIGFTVGAVLAEILTVVWMETILAKQDALVYGVLKIERQGERYQAHPYMNFVPRPGFEKMDPKSGEAKSRFNSLGFRGPDIEVPKPSGVFRIVFIGGSAPFSSRVADDAGTISAQTQRKLRDLGYRRVEVVNAAVPGYSTAEALAMLQFRVLEISPDLIIVYEGMNDLHNRYVPPELFHADNRGRLQDWRDNEWPWWMYSKFLRVLGYKIGFAKKYFFTDYYVAAPTYLGHTADASLSAGVDYEKLLKANGTRFYRENLQSIFAICRARNIPVMMTTYPHTDAVEELGYLNTKNYRAGLKEINQAAREVSAANKIPLLDLDVLMPTAKELWRDEIHVSVSGAAVMAGLFTDFIVKNQMVRP